MHGGVPSWLGVLIEYWHAALVIALLLLIYVVGAVVTAIRWRSLKIGLAWPLFYLFYGGPQ